MKPAVTALSLLVIAATFVPYLLLDANPPEGTEFSWISTHLPDSASYLMWAGEHRDGAVFGTNRMTTDQSPPIPPNLTWLLVGWMSRLTKMSLTASYHVARTVFALGYLLTLWALLARFIENARTRWLTFVIIAVGGGFGWLDAMGIQVDSADWITELWTFGSILYFPHFALALWLLTATLLLWKDSISLADYGRAVGAGVTLGALVLVHPYTAGTVALVLAVWLVIGLRQWRTEGPGRLSYTVTTLAVAGLFFAFQAWQLTQNPTLATWAVQNRMPSPPPWSYVSGLGFVGIAAIAGMTRLTVERKWDDNTLFLLTWIVVVFILAYSDPLLPFERRCVEGVHIAVAIMAGGFVGRYLEKATSGLSAAIAIIIFGLFVAPSSIVEVSNQLTDNNPGFVPNDQDSLYDAVESAVGQEGIFSDPRMSLFLAAFTKSRVFAGHHELTPDFGGRIRLVERFFSTSITWPERMELLDSAGCNWVVTTPGISGALLEPDMPENVHVRARGKSWVLIDVTR